MQLFTGNITLNYLKIGVSIMIILLDFKSEFHNGVEIYSPLPYLILSPVLNSRNNRGYTFH